MTADSNSTAGHADSQPAILEAVLETSLDGVLVIDEERDYVLWNDRFVELWGVPEDFLEEHPEETALDWAMGQLTNPEEFIEKVEYLYDHPMEESRDEIELRDGRWIDRYSAPVSKDDGTHIGRVWFFRDITERKQSQTELEEISEQLEALNRVVRHDIRNDMSIMLGWAELLEDHVDDAGQTHLEKILNSGTHIVELTKIAREYVETLTGGEESRVKPTPLQSVLRTEIHLRRESFPKARIFVDGDVPDVEVVANGMLGSVFRNLLTNAAQHNDAPEPVVKVSCTESDSDVVVSIADNGPGIADDRKESVFGKGAQGLDSSGTGIGLHLVDTLVADYGGEVWVEDNEPRGSIFEVRLPKAHS
jgi:PAS domain S-box-containing protein